MIRDKKKTERVRATVTGRTSHSWLEELLPQLSGAETKIAVYLQSRFQKDDIVSITDEQLSAATGVSRRQIATARKTLAEKTGIGVEIVPRRGTCYSLAGGEPSAANLKQRNVRLAKNQRPAKKSNVRVKQSEKNQVVAGPSPGPESPAQTGHEPDAPVVQQATPETGPSLPQIAPSLEASPAASRENTSSETTERDAALRPAPPPPTAVEPKQVQSKEEQIAAIVARMMEGQKPTQSYLQGLVWLGGNADLLLECLEWMEEYVDPNLGILRYQFERDQHNLLAVAVSNLCQLSDSEFLEARQRNSPLSRHRPFELPPL